MLLAGPEGEFPINDDILYTTAVRSLVESGTFRIQGSNAFDFIPLQLGGLLCSALGFSYNFLRAISIGFQLFGALGLYMALKEMGLDRVASAVFTAVFALNPFLINLSLTFMTDVPALALTNWLFYLIVLAMRKKSLSYWLMSVGMFTAAISVRQSILVFLPALVGSGLIALKGFKRKLLFLLSFALPALAFVALKSWLRAISEGNTGDAFARVLLESALLSPARILELFSETCCYVGLFVIPITVPLTVLIVRRFCQKKWIMLLSFLLSLSVTALPLYFLALAGKQMPYSQNLFSPPFIGCYNVIGGESLWAEKYLAIFTCLAALAAVLFVFCIVFAAGNCLYKNDVRKDLRFFLFAVIVPALYGLLIQLQTNNLDRYYTLFIAPVLLLFAGLWSAMQANRFALVFSTVLSLGLAAYGTAAASDSMNFHRAQWQSIRKLEGLGIDPLRIDGGPQYNRINGGVKLARSYVHTAKEKGWPQAARGGPVTSTYRWWPVNRDDYIVSCYFLPGYHVIGGTKYWSAILWKSKTIYLLEADVVSQARF